MPASADPPLLLEPQQDDGQWLAVSAQALYLLNLLALPGLAWLILSVFYYQSRQRRLITTPLGRCHLHQAWVASLWAVVLILGMSLIFLWLGGLKNPYTWLILILYVTTVHSTLVLLGMMALSKAWSGQHYHYYGVRTSCPGY